MALISLRPAGLYCAAGDFYIDPWKPVERAVVTHAHADHARVGMTHYYATRISEGVLRHRLGADIDLHTFAYGESFNLGDAKVSLHSAGHVLGSAQVRVEYDGEVWVAAGDYKRAADPTCAPFEVIPCDAFITEATFALPVYRWPSGAEIARDIFDWWQAHDGVTMVFCYSFGKAQRLLAELMAFTDQPVYLHGAMTVLTDLYRREGIAMLPTVAVNDTEKGFDFSSQLVLAPPAAHRSAWMKRFKNLQTGFASGWMRVRGNRRRRGYERGFILSDHADWPALERTVLQTGAQRIFVTHGQNETFARFLRERHQLDAQPLSTLYEGEAGS